MTRGGQDAPPPAGDAATRLTLNHALGNLGGRQKSWMNPDQQTTITPQPSSVVPKKRGRPRKYPDEYPEAEPSARRLAREQPASNSTSPQLANVLSHLPNPQPLPSPTAVLPSPSPSEDAIVELHTPAAPIDAPSRGGSYMSHDQHNGISSSHPNHRLFNGARQSTGTIQRPAVGTTLPVANNHSRTFTDAQRPRRSAPTPLRILDGSTDPLHSNQRILANQPLSASPTVHETFSPSLDRPSRDPSNPTRALQSGRQKLSPKLAPGDMRAHLLQELARFQTLHQFPPNCSDRKRLTALEQATKQMDWDYLITHLFYCLLSLDPTALPVSIRTSEYAASTEGFLCEVLDFNSNLMPTTQAFFTQFPITLKEWAKLNPSHYRADIEHFNAFMVHSPAYFRLKSLCDQRNLPPTMHELNDDLCIVSRQLQAIVFTAAVRRLWFNEGNDPGDVLNQYENSAMQYFTATQKTFFNRRSRPQPHGTLQERELEMDSWRNIFKGLRSMHNPVAVDGQQSHGWPWASPNTPLTQSSFQLAEPAAQRGRGRPRGRPRLAMQQPRSQSQYEARVQECRPFLPRVGHREPQQHMPNPVRFALHQAHLRGPSMRSKTGGRLYLYAQSFVRQPRHLLAAHGVETWKFTLKPEQIASIPKLVAADTLPIRTVDETSFMLRLRCVKWASQVFDEHRWATSETSWSPYSFFELNHRPLEQRRKIHWGRDLPIDLTPFLKEGENDLQIAVIPSEEQSHDYLVAIETLEVKTHAALVEDILTKRHVPAALAKQRIKDKLAGVTACDDEIAVVNSTLNIALFDPFSLSAICAIPVRSQVCDHFDCFDLETFLTTRKRNGDCTEPDNWNWRCPICSGDARPHLLMVDGFMQEVRGELEKQGLLKTRAIIMSDDGSWKAKAEVLEGVADDDDEEEHAGASGRRPSGQQKKTPVPHGMEVIDLDSD